VRSGPPAPLVPMEAPRPSSASQVVAPAPSTSVHEAPAKSIIVRNEPVKPQPPEPARIEPPKAEPVPAPSEAAKTPPQAAPKEPVPHPDQITAGKNDTIYTIARRYDIPVRSIIDANHIEPPFTLTAGMKLDLPQDRVHTVHPGDTLYSISRLYGVEVSALASLNHIEAPFAIRVGQNLALPTPVAPPEQAVAAVPPASKPPLAPSPQSPAEAPPSAKPAPVPEPGHVASAPPTKPRSTRVFAWPVEGRIISSYGTAASGTHNDGINIAVRAGEPVRAADAGKVAYAGNELRGYGNLVLIKHTGGYMTAYAHNGKLLVKRGQAVQRGQEIAKAGATGTVNAPQLHFEIRQGTRALDPTDYLPSLRASAD
jgi:murein DD-endopeptidase MepM/ murein hydrolase activator NlpD